MEGRMEGASYLGGDLKSEVNYQMTAGWGVQGRGNMEFQDPDVGMSME